MAFKSKPANDKKFFLTWLSCLTLGLTGTPAVWATKLNAKPLPRASDLNHQYKDFSSSPEDREALPPSRWGNRRPDYRDVEKQEKEEAAQKALRAQTEQKKQLDAQKKLEQDKVNAIRQVQANAIEANNRAINLGRQGLWNEAIAQHELSLRLDPGNKQFRTNLSAARCTYGRERMAKKDFSGAAHLFRKSLTAANDNALAARLLNEAIQRSGLDPMLTDNRLGLGDQLAASGDLEGAMIEYQQAMQLDPSARTYTKMGDMAARYGQIPNAISWYRQAIVKDPEFGAAHRQLGLMYMAQRDYTGAAASLRKAVIADSKDNAAGQALIEIWRKQVSQNPTLAENHLGLAGALQLTGDFNSAQSEYMQVEQLAPTHPALTAGRQSLARAIKHSQAERHRLAAETFFSQGLKREALSEISQAVMAEPKNYKYQLFLGQCLEDTGDYKGALQAYHTSVLTNPQDNAEGAQRMKELKERLGGGIPAGGNQGSNQGNFALPNQLPSPNQPQTLNQPNFNSNNAPTRPKSFYEGSNSPEQNAFTGSFNTHSDNYPPAHQENLSEKHIERDQAFSQGASKEPTKSGNLDQATQNTLNSAGELELKRDFKGAADLLREGLSNNMQNPEIHHKLAVNLLNLGEVVEAITEFRIASALAPGNKIFAQDLASALNIHKRSLNSANNLSGEGNKP